MIQNIDRKKITFGLIGVFNTLFDLAIYVVVYNITNSIVLAVIVANIFALVGSYILNSKLTFKSKQWTTQSFLLFMGVTIFGVWILQSFVIYAISPLLHHVPNAIWSLVGGFQESVKTIVPKLIATVASFIWNYIWYSRVIFKEESKETRALLALEDS